jgi:hypothetical protein
MDSISSTAFADNRTGILAATLTGKDNFLSVFLTVDAIYIDIQNFISFI